MIQNAYCKATLKAYTAEKGIWRMDLKVNSIGQSNEVKQRVITKSTAICMELLFTVCPTSLAETQIHDYSKTTDKSQNWKISVGQGLLDLCRHIRIVSKL